MGGGGGFNEFHHAGYEGTHTVLECEPDYWSYFSLIATIKRLGYPMISQLWYYDPYMLYELIRLKSDKCCRRMQAIAEMNGRVHLYVIHSVGAPEIHNLNPLDEANDFLVPNVGVVLEEIVEEGQNVGGAGLNLPMIEYPVGINGEMAMGEAMVEDQGSVEYMVEKEGSAEIMM
ncbi:hypothetical protein MtrunA17_Chr3g0101791 [Medicago truncatula]|uniref:PB1-like domain-containing protein n=1 Tax=Medicago truncatula TaxID=3880 RepID=A0A396IRR2_MEDTR|nr:hypothetical protein MtrunA17_Chr3g0101791 [Medicago truncatula]